MSKQYMGIDPGKSGGIAVIGTGGEVLGVCKLDSEAGIVEFLSAWQGASAVLEKVSSSPQQGVVSAFTFGNGYGFVRGVLFSLGIRFDLVLPKKWQAEIGCLSGGDKNVTKERAQQLYPDEVVTHWKADALLLAEYARRLFGGKGERR